MRCFVDGEHYERETFRYLLSNPDAIARQIRSEYDEMSAFAIGVIEQDGVGHITTIGVAPEYRRRGLARLILHEVERSFAARGVTTVRLEVRTQNVAAQKMNSAERAQLMKLCHGATHEQVLLERRRRIPDG